MTWRSTSSYMSRYEDFGSRARLRADRGCGHYPKMAGSPCAACVDKALAQAYRRGAKDMRRGLRGVRRGGGRERREAAAEGGA